MAERPAVPYRLVMFWNAWCELGSCRPPAFSGVAPIPWTALDRYARRHGWTDDEFEMLRVIVQALDDEMSEHAEKQAKTRSATPDA